MKFARLVGCLALAVCGCPVTRLARAQTNSVFQETAGLVAVEAEHFFQQTATETRAFYLTNQSQTPDVNPDGDPSHVADASGGAYLEVLPDTRRTHDDKLIKGTNFSSEPGQLAVLHYKVNFTSAGRYYVWARCYSTGSEDNGLHVGLNGQWPESGQRLQWCVGKNTWRWDSKQRTEAEHCGEPHKIFLDIDRPGEHTIHFSMREDGFEFDKWLMTTNREFAGPEGKGPESKLFSGDEPPALGQVLAPASVATPQVARTAANAPLRQVSSPVQHGPSDSPTKPVSSAPLIEPRRTDGSGKVQISGELKKWHSKIG